MHAQRLFVSLRIQMWSAAFLILARKTALSLQAPMADGANATTLIDPPELFVPAGGRGPTPIADSSESDAEEILRARFLWELDAERGRRVQRDRERRWPQAASWRDSSPRRAGWSCSSADSRSCKDARRERAMTRPRQASTEGRPRKRCFVSRSGGPTCRHLAVKVFPTGLRDNGEVYWQCAFCDADL